MIGVLLGLACSLIGALVVRAIVNSSSNSRAATAYTWAAFLVWLGVFVVLGGYSLGVGVSPQYGWFAVGWMLGPPLDVLSGTPFRRWLGKRSTHNR